MASQSLPTVILRPGEAPRILAGHPWIFEGNILRITQPAENGQVVQVKDHRQRFLGTGFFNSLSKIRVRLLSPKRLDLNTAFFRGQIEKALAYRSQFGELGECYRLINAESDFLSGLTVDRFDSQVVVQTTSLGMDQRLPMLVDILTDLLKPSVIWERNDLASRRMEGLDSKKGVLWKSSAAEPPATSTIALNGIRFPIDFLAGHKTGFYLDQRQNYLNVSRLCRGKKVLDCFSFMGGFALHAARAGASEVLGLEQNPQITALATRAAQDNSLQGQCRFESTNVFDWLKEKTQPAALAQQPSSLYDVIILDPPSFTRSKSTLPEALRGYKEIHLRAMKLLKPGGLLFSFCCSHHVSARVFEDVILEAAFDARKLLRRFETYTQAFDHPIIPSIPETEYLKGYAYEVSEAQ